MITKADIFRIHDEVNKAEYATDEEVYGVPDHWADILTSPDRKGDCEDTMIGKAHMALVAAHCPVELLRFATYWTGPNRTGYHAVLLVDLPMPEGICTYMLSNGLPFPLVAADIPVGWQPHMYQIAGTDKWEYA